MFYLFRLFSPVAWSRNDGDRRRLYTDAGTRRSVKTTVQTSIRARRIFSSTCVVKQLGGMSGGDALQPGGPRRERGWKKEGGGGGTEVEVKS